MASRMMITLPAVMLLSRLDYEDPNILMLARAAYFTVAGLSFLLHKLAASKIEGGGGDALNPVDTVIYVPIVQMGMMGPSPINENGPRKKTTYKEHELGECGQKTQQSMVTGLLMLFLTFKMGVHMPLLLQCVMGLMDLVNAPVIKRHILKMGTDKAYKDMAPSDRPYKELFEGEEGAVDSSNAESGEEISPDAAAAAGGAGGGGGADLDEQMRAATVNAWTGQPFTADPFVKLHKEGGNVNVQTTEDGWTPLMVAAGTRGMDMKFFEKLIECGARPEVTDTDGWTALHWSACHGNVLAVRGVLHNATPETEAMLLGMKSNEDETPQQLAESELAKAQQKLSQLENGEKPESEEEGPAHWEAIIESQKAVISALETRKEEVDALLEASADHEAEESKGGEDGSGLRQRKPAGDDHIEDID